MLILCYPEFPEVHNETNLGKPYIDTTHLLGHKDLNFSGFYKQTHENNDSTHLASRI